MTAQETQAHKASEPKSIPEQRTPENILDPKSISIYGRLYIAATDDGADMEKVLSPEIKMNLPSEPPSEHFLEKPQRYNNITWGLSKNERTDAWRNVSGSFEDKKKKWNENLRASISVASDTRKLVITHFTGKDLGHTEDEINTTLYDTFCNGKSNVSGFVKKALENPDIDFTEVEWLAVKLFGQESGKVVKKILELESSISTNEKATFDLLFSDPNKINSPTEDELGLLNKLRDGYLGLTDNEKREIKAELPRPNETVSKNTPAGNPPARPMPNQENASTGPVFANPDEKIKAYEEAIEDVKKGETPIDPATGKSLTSKGSEEKDIEYLNDRIDDLKHHLEKLADHEKASSELEKSGDLLFIRSRIILTVKNSNEKYYVNILDEYASGDKKDEDRFLTLEPLEQGISSDKMTKKDLLVKILGENPDYEFDPLEGSRIKVGGDDDKYYYVRTYFQPRDIDERDQGEYIRLFNDFADANENRIEEMPRSQFEEEVLFKKIEIINESDGNKNSVSTAPANHSEASVETTPSATEADENHGAPMPDADYSDAPTSEQLSLHQEAEMPNSATTKPAEPTPAMVAFDTVSVPDYNWGAALNAAREANPGNNLYREGSKFSKLVEQLSQGEIVPREIKSKDYRRLNKMQKDAAEKGVPLPIPDSENT